ncbi:MAG: beta-propeller fold lactonase family protein, partial [Deltaproteobacteria bacterium]|nr:beta-propeller fold lactonase family protein [Deltaproteobacteria bacterium]
MKARIFNIIGFALLFILTAFGMGPVHAQGPTLIFTGYQGDANVWIGSDNGQNHEVITLQQQDLIQPQPAGTGLAQETQNKTIYQYSAPNSPCVAAIARTNRNPVQYQANPLSWDFSIHFEVDVNNSPQVCETRSHANLNGTYTAQLAVPANTSTLKIEYAQTKGVVNGSTGDIILTILDSSNQVVLLQQGPTSGIDLKESNVTPPPGGETYTITVQGVGISDTSTAGSPASILLGTRLKLTLGPTSPGPPQAFMYVTNENDDTVRVIDTATNSLVATVNVGDQPEGIAVTPEGSRAYVANYGSGTVSVINMLTNPPAVTTILVGGHPHGLAISPNGAQAYVTDRFVGIVSVIDTTSNTVVGTVSVGVGPYQVAFTPDGSRAYVTNLSSNTVSVIDTATRTVTTTVPVGAGPTGVAVTPDGSRVYVANNQSGTLSIISTASNTVIGTVTVGVLGDPYMVAITPDGRHVYVANYNSGNVAVVATEMNAVTTIPVGRLPFGVALTTDGTRAYITNICGSTPGQCSEGTVSVIDTSLNSVITTLTGISVAGLKFIAIQPPVIGSPAATSLTVSNATGPYGGTTALSATLTSGGSDVGGKTINFYLNGNSVGTATTDSGGLATLNAVSLAGINAGVYPGGVSASFSGDPSYNGSTGSAQLIVSQVNTNLTVSPASGAYGGTTTLSATLTSGGSGLGNKMINFALNGTPAGGANTDSNGLATLTGVSLSGINTGTYSNGVTATFPGDSIYGASSGSAQLTVIHVNGAPNLNQIGNQIINEGQTLTFTVNGSDSDGDPLIFSAANLPDGAGFNPSIRIFSWTPGYSQAGTYPGVRFEVSDGSLTDFEDITITVNNVNRPPVLNTIGTQSVNEGSTLTFTVGGSDPDGDNLTFEASNLPQGATFDPATQVFFWIPGYGQAGSYQNVLFKVTDNGSPLLSASEAITVIVGNVNQPPVLASIGPKSGKENELLTFAVSATDPDGDGLTYTASNLPAGATFDPSTQILNWTPGYDQSGNYSVLFTVTDNGAPPQSDSETVTITVGNVNRPPVLNPIGSRSVGEG